MRLSVLSTDPRHPVVPWLERWQREMQTKGHDVRLHTDRAELLGGDILFLISCGQIISASDRRRFRAVLVVHASDLPQDRGWSPHVWSVLSGRDRIVVSLLEAADAVDSGDIWLQEEFTLEGHELLLEINERLFKSELSLMTKAVEQIETVKPMSQSGTPTYVRRRIPEDSRLLPEKSIAEQFDLLRVVDNERYPAFFEYRGARYLLKIDKVRN